MTFTFKLSRRIARLRAIALIASIFYTVSCADQNGPSDSTSPLGQDPTGVQLTPDSSSVEVTKALQFHASLDTTAAEFRSWDGKGHQYPKVVSLSVTPASVQLPVRGSQTFRAVARMSDSSNVVLFRYYSWSATGGSIDRYGRYVAGDIPGKFQVTVRTWNGIADTAIVTVTPPASPPQTPSTPPTPSTVARVVLSPSAATVVPGGARQFRAVAEAADGSELPLEPDFVATGGTVSEAGVYEARSTPGTFRVIASDPASGKADTAAVTITPSAPILERIVVTPATASLTTEASQQFTASAKMSDGSTTNVPVNWTTNGGGVASSGLFTAGKSAGTFRVVATDNASGKADTATITVTAPPPTLQAVVLTPATASLASGATQQFTAVGKMSDGSTKTVTINWTAGGGQVSGNGLYTAGETSGNYRVIAAEAGGKADTATITVTAPAPTLQAVVLTPATASLASGATQQFTAVGKMSDGSTKTVTINWTAGGGQVSGNGLYTAGGTSGNYRVIAAAAGGKADTAAITITAPAPPAPPPPPPPPPPPSGGCDTDTSDLQFYGNFEGSSPYSGWDIGQVGANPWNLQDVSSPARECGQAVRIELRRTDPIIAGSNRAQIQVQQTGTGNGGVPVPSGRTIAGGMGDERWFGFSVYIPSDWTFETSYAPDLVWEALDGARSPPLALSIHGSNWMIDNRTGHGSQNDPSWVNRLDYSPVQRGAWTDWVIHVKWSGGTAGILQIWKNGTLVVNRSGTWTTYTDTGNYMKPLWGIYKWPWNGSTSGGPSIVTKRVLYIDNVRVTDGAHGSYEAVAPH